MNTQPTNVKYPEYTQQNLNHGAYPVPNQGHVQYYASPAPVQFVMYAPANGVAKPVIYPSMPQMGAIPAQEVAVHPPMEPVPQAPQPTMATTSLMDRKDRISLLILGIISLVSAVFFCVYLPTTGTWKSMSCYTSYYNDQPSSHCSIHSTSWSVFLGFGWTTVVTSFIQGAFLIGMFAANNPNGLRVTLIISMITFALYALVEIAAAITNGAFMYFLYWDATTVHVVSCLISFASLAASFVVYRKIAIGGYSASATKTPLSSVALLGKIVSTVTTILGTSGLILTGIFFFWLYSTLASLMYTACGIIGIIAHSLSSKHMKVKSVLFRINIVIGWMLAGTGIIIGTQIVMLTHVPWASCAALVLAAWPAANAALSMIAVYKIDREAATAPAPVEEPAPVETEADNVGLISKHESVNNEI